MQIGVETTILLGAISALAGVITFLWKQVSDNHKAVYAKLTDCEQDREELWKAMYSIHPAAREIKK